MALPSPPSHPDETQAYNKALTTAYRQLARSPQTESEIRKRLGRALLPPLIIDRVIDRLKAEGVLDDRAFARQWVRERFERRGFGPLRLRHELRRKGVAEETIEESIGDGVGREEGEARAVALLSLRLGTECGPELDDPRERRRWIGFLLRRGYSGEVARAALRIIEREGGWHPESSEPD